MKKTDCTGGGRHRPAVLFLRRLRPLIAFHIWRAALPVRGSLVGDDVHIVGGFFIGLLAAVHRAYDSAANLPASAGTRTPAAADHEG